MERGRETVDLGAPLLDHAHRADDERRPERLVARVLPLRRQHRDRLHRLAEAHVVGEDRADAEVAEQPQPAVAALLEREERMRHRCRRGQRPEAALAGVEECGERLVERHLAELDPGFVRLEPRDGAHEVDDSGAGAAAVEEAERLLDVRPLDGVPAVADPDERLLGGGEVGELLVRQLGVADGEAPVEPSQLGRGEEAARAGARRARRRQVDADARRRPEPRRRQEDRHVALLELRHRLAEEEPHLLRAELRLRRLGHVEFDADLGQHRLQLGEVADEVTARIAGAQEGEDVAVRAPEQRGGEAQGRIVARLQPELEHEPRLLSLREGWALVELEADPPLGAGQRPEPAVDPVGEPAFERGKAGVAGKHGVGRRQPFEQVVDRIRPPHLRGREPHAVGAQAVACDLVDEDGIEVVDGRFTVAREGAGADGRERGRNRSERGLDAFVQGGAPERVPPAVAVIEERMDETLGDRAPCQLHDREDGARARAELEVPGRRLRERDELRWFEPACRDAAAREREIGDRRHARTQLARRERAVSVTLEHERRRVVLPHDFERRCGLAWAQFGCGLNRHRPIRVGVSDDDLRPRPRTSCQLEESVSFISASPPCISPVATKPQRS